MLKYLIAIIIIFIIFYFLSILKDKYYKESFIDDFKVNVMGASALENVVNAVFNKEDKPVSIDVNNTLGEQQRLVQDSSHTISSDEIAFPENCPINLHCSEPPTKNEQSILDIYRNNLKREPDRMGFYYWMGRIKKGDTIESISQAFKNSPEYKQVLEGKDVVKFDEINNLEISKPILKENNCRYNYGELTGDVNNQYICSEKTPICLGYIPNKTDGMCKKNGGTDKNNKVVVLGHYDMHPWNLNDSWSDKQAKWIWSKPNGDVVECGSSICKFDYKYFKVQENDFDVEIHIVVDKYAYVHLNGKYLFTQTGGWPNSGIHKEIKLKEGVNYFEVYVVNDGIRANPAGLIMTVIGSKGQDLREPLFHTDDSWTYTDALPKKNNILFEHRKESINQEPTLLNPLIALWNKKHSGFLKMDVDTSINEYTSRGKMSILHSEHKMLPNTFDMENAIFKFSRTEQWVTDNTYSLYNCKHFRYIRTNGTSWTIDTSNLNANQNLLEQWGHERWIPVYNNDGTLSFKSAEWKDRYLYVIDNKTIISKQLTVPDENSKWEIFNIDTLYFGKSNEMFPNTDNKPGFISKIPESIGYVGHYPINMQYYREIKGEKPWMYSTELLWNDSQLSYGTKKNNTYWNTTTVFRTDPISGDVGWEQQLQMLGINKKYVNRLIPSFEVLSTGTAKQMVLSKDHIICLATNNTPYIRKLNETALEANSWVPFDNANSGSSIIVGEINKEEVVFMIGESNFGYIYYRKFNEIYKGQWIQYNNDANDFKQICFDKKTKQLIGLKTNGELFFVTSTTNVKINLPTDIVEISILDKKVGTTLLFIDTNGYLHLSELSGQNAEKPVLLADNIKIKKMTTINNIIFAIGKDDGKLYFKPISKMIPFRIYNNSMEGNLIDIHIYQDKLYALNSSNKLLRCLIIIN